jgi:hypothetical protein
MTELEITIAGQTFEHLVYIQIWKGHFQVASQISPFGFHAAQGWTSRYALYASCPEHCLVS